MPCLKIQSRHLPGGTNLNEKFELVTSSYRYTSLSMLPINNSEMTQHITNILWRIDLLLRDDSVNIGRCLVMPHATVEVVSRCATRTTVAMERAQLTGAR